MLVSSVFRIRNFFKAKNAEEVIDTRMLARHAIAFGLYMVSDLVRYSSFTLYAFHTSNLQLWNLYNWAVCFWMVCSLISNLLLCTIFWDLGTDLSKQRLKASIQMTTDGIVEEAEFDEDAEM
jgi:hypothetical protein